MTCCGRSHRYEKIDRPLDLRLPKFLLESRFPFREASPTHQWSVVDHWVGLLSLKNSTLGRNAMEPRQDLLNLINQFSDEQLTLLMPLVLSFRENQLLLGFVWIRSFDGSLFLH